MFFGLAFFTGWFSVFWFLCLSLCVRIRGLFPSTVGFFPDDNAGRKTEQTNLRCCHMELLSGWLV